MVTSVGRQEGIEDIRIFNKQGYISFSSHADDVGKTLDIRSQECQECHASRAIPDSLHRRRIYTDVDGHQVLATMRSIPNQEIGRAHV